MHKWRTKEFFGIQKYLGFQVPINSFEIRNHIDKFMDLDHLSRYLKQLEGEELEGKFNHIGDIVKVCVDELLTNAIYKANLRFESFSFPPGFELNFEDEERVVLEWDFDGKRLAFAVQDFLGRPHEY